MPTRAQLEAEPVWVAQIVPPNMTALLIRPLREHYNLGPNLIGAPGDEFHLRGRHRSYRWDVLSHWCTDRGYATTDPRDRRGDGNWYRALDAGITGPALYAACRRIDALVRAGRLPGLAEWFGTFDGQTVVGWYEGHPSSSDSSHLRHLHLGLWTQYANDETTLRLLYAAITGEEDDDMDVAQSAALTDCLNILTALAAGRDSVTVHDKDGRLDLTPFYRRVAAEVGVLNPGAVHVHDLAGSTGPAQPADG